MGTTFKSIQTATWTNCTRYSSIKMAKPNVVFVLGGPGAGKGTQCARIVEKFGYVHLSAGDLLRAERNTPGSEHGETIEHHIVNGTIVPVAITCSLLERAMQQSEKNDFLIDGFPRNEDNLQGWNEAVGDNVNLKFVLFLDCSENTCIERCLKRGAAGSGRSDDNEESLKKRFNTYFNATKPIIEHFDKQNLVKKVNTDRDVEDIWSEIQELFQ